MSVDTFASFVGGSLFACAALLLLWKGHALFKRLPAAQHRRFTEDLRADVEALICAELHVAEMHGQIAGRIGKMPADFSAPAFLAIRMGYAVERAVVEEAVRRGLYAKAVSEDLGKTEALPGQDAPDPEASRLEGRVARENRGTTAAANDPLTMWDAEGHVVPFRRSR